MSAKFMFLIFAAFLIAQSSAVPRERRDAPETTTDASGMDSIKQGFENLIAKAQENFKPEKIWDDISTSFKTLADKLNIDPKEISNTIQRETSKLMNTAQEKPAAS